VDHQYLIVCLCSTSTAHQAHMPETAITVGNTLPLYGVTLCKDSAEVN